MIIYQLTKLGGVYYWVGTFNADVIPSETDRNFFTSNRDDVKKLDGQPVIPTINKFDMCVVLKIHTERSEEEVIQGIKSALYKGLDQPPHYIATPGNCHIISIEKLK